MELSIAAQFPKVSNLKQLMLHKSQGSSSPCLGHLDLQLGTWVADPPSPLTVCPTETLQPLQKHICTAYYAVLSHARNNGRRSVPMIVSGTTGTHFWLNSRVEYQFSLRVRNNEWMSESLFWVPILAADGPYWVPIPGKVGSLFLSMEVLISFGNSAVGRILPQCVFSTCNRDNWIRQE